MLKAALLDAWPLALALFLTCGALATLVRLLNVKRETRNVKLGAWNTSLQRLHINQRGSVQSLSFVLTVPIFIMLMLLAVQITQLMIGMIVVHYAAFAAARSASVWIPARMDSLDELENRISQRTLIGEEHSGELYQIGKDTPKFDQIRRAAALACIPIAPSRMTDVNPHPRDASEFDPTPSLIALFAAYSPTGTSNGRIPQRLVNKWNYASAATTIDIVTYHRRYGTVAGRLWWDEPPLWLPPSNLPEGYYQSNEIGYRDQIRVTVYHQFALLPGPGRLLARRTNETVRPDTVSPRILSRGNSLYTIQLSATATMVGEGEKSVRPYVQRDS